jgi:hypothetical protein
MRTARDLPAWVEEALPRIQKDASAAKLSTSLVQALEGTTGTTYGHSVEILGFGKIFLSELTVEEHERRQLTLHLSMMRMQLSSALEGGVRVVDVVCSSGRVRDDAVAPQSTRSTYVISVAPPVITPLGIVTERLKDLHLAKAMPAMQTAEHLVRPEFITLAHESDVAPELRHSNVWSAALETRVLELRGGGRPTGTMFTTYGFIWTPEGLRLGIIHYVDPFAPFRSGLSDPITIAGWRFPVMIRP